MVIPLSASCQSVPSMQDLFVVNADGKVVEPAQVRFEPGWGGEGIYNNNCFVRVRPQQRVRYTRVYLFGVIVQR